MTRGKEVNDQVNKYRNKATVILATKKVGKKEEEEEEGVTTG